jgi:hypothetical protein
VFDALDRHDASHSPFDDLYAFNKTCQSQIFEQVSAEIWDCVMIDAAVQNSHQASFIELPQISTFLDSKGRSAP